MFALLFSCCGLHRPHDPPDERTPLIPHADDTPTPQPRVIDHQKLKERLGSVVRSKEGKMVNVNAQFPFNLHNQEHPEHSSSRSSRNVSGGTLSSSRAASPSPPRELHKSCSTISFPPGVEDVPHYFPLVVNPSASILNVRLVKSTRSAHSIRGRSPRSGDSVGPTTAVELQSELVPEEQQHTPRAHPPPSSLEQGSHPPVKLEALPYHPEDFSIYDAGAVARSWGD